MLGLLELVRYYFEYCVDEIILLALGNTTASDNSSSNSRGNSGTSTSSDSSSSGSNGA